MAFFKKNDNDIVQAEILSFTHNYIGYEHVRHYGLRGDPDYSI